MRLQQLLRRHTRRETRITTDEKNENDFSEALEWILSPTLSLSNILNMTWKGRSYAWTCLIQMRDNAKYTSCTISMPLTKEDVRLFHCLHTYVVATFRMTMTETQSLLVLSYNAETWRMINQYLPSSMQQSTAGQQR